MAEWIGRGLLIHGLILVPKVNVFTSLMGIPVGSELMMAPIQIQIKLFSTLLTEVQVGQNNILRIMVYSASSFGMKTTAGLLANIVGRQPILIQRFVRE